MGPEGDRHFHGQPRSIEGPATPVRTPRSPRWSSARTRVVNSRRMVRIGGLRIDHNPTEQRGAATTARLLGEASMRTTITLLSACVMASVGSATLLLPRTATAAVAIQVVIASGDLLPRGGVFQASEVPVINDAGQIVFSGNDLPAQSSFRWDPAPPQFLRIVGAGSTVPGGGVVYSAFVGALNDAGESAFSAELVGFPADSPRMYRSNGAALVEIVRETAAAPGGNGTIASFSPGILNHAAASRASPSPHSTRRGSSVSRPICSAPVAAATGASSEPTVHPEVSSRSPAGARWRPAAAQSSISSTPPPPRSTSPGRSSSWPVW
jgi:hypothetical protein